MTGIFGVAAPAGAQGVTINNVTNDAANRQLIFDVNLPLPTATPSSNGFVAYSAPWVATEHTIIVPYGAIPDRMNTYGIGTRLAAIHAIMREHVQRVTGIAAPSTGNLAQDALGGLNTVVTSQIAPSAAGTVLANLASF